MSFSLVLFYDAQSAPSLGADEVAALRAVLAAIPGAVEAMIFTPAVASDAFVDDGAAPPLGLQLQFPTLETLEAACTPASPLAKLGDVVASLSQDAATVQAFWRRSWGVDEPALQTAPGALPCSYVVHYPGPAQDLNAWLDHYIAGHPPLFQRLPGIRAIEILTRVDWVSHLPMRKVNHMQRNRVMFDSPEALTAALQSPVRHELRADFHTFPPFEGGNFHYPMWTEMVPL